MMGADVAVILELQLSVAMASREAKPVSAWLFSWDFNFGLPGFLVLYGIERLIDNRVVSEVLFNLLFYLI